jgi:hypothetical protein
LAALLRSAGARAAMPEESADEAWRNDPAQAEKIPVDGFRRRLRTLIHVCRDFAIRPVLLTQPLAGITNQLTPDWADMGAQARFNTVIRQVGVQEGATVIDLDLFLRREVPDWDRPMNIFYDGMHVTDHGSQVYAALITDKLLPVIEEVADGSPETGSPVAAEPPR